MLLGFSDPKGTEAETEDTQIPGAQGDYVHNVGWWEGNWGHWRYEKYTGRGMGVVTLYDRKTYHEVL